MIVNIIIFLWLLLIFTIGCFVAKEFSCGSSTYLFQNYGKTDVPYITIDIQGIPVNMLVDTGCGVSILSKDIIDQLSYERSKRKINLEALTSESIPTDTVSIAFNVGKKEVCEDFVVYDKPDIANFQANYGIVLHGLLGNEFLEKTGCKINYKNHSISLY